ncbi:class I SAM-dependent methyltransferase [Bacteroidota bacterium]
MSNDHMIINSGKSYATADEIQAYNKLLEMSKHSPIPAKEVLANLGLFLVRVSMSRMLFMHHIYLKALSVHGVIMEFGVRWGQNMALFTTFRNIHEPYNLSRKIIGFDTFEGFPNIAKENGSSSTVAKGALAVTHNYDAYLDDLLNQHEQLAPRSHIKKHELIKGNVIETLPKYLNDHPETIIALAYFDLDLYEPTKKCLELIKPHLAKNSIIGFDELVLEEVPGETQALKDAWGLSNYEIIRDTTSPQQSYLIFK